MFYLHKPYNPYNTYNPYNQGSDNLEVKNDTIKNSGFGGQLFSHNDANQPPQKVSGAFWMQLLYVVKFVMQNRLLFRLLSFPLFRLKNSNN